MTSRWESSAVSDCGRSEARRSRRLNNVRPRLSWMSRRRRKHTKARSHQLGKRFSTYIYLFRKKPCGSGSITTKPSCVADMTTYPRPHSVRALPGHHLSVQPRHTETPNGAEGQAEAPPGQSYRVIGGISLQTSSGTRGELFLPAAPTRTVSLWDVTRMCAVHVRVWTCALFVFLFAKL